MNMQPSAKLILVLLAAAALAACSSIPEPRMLVASNANQQQIQALAAKTGAVADVLTLNGEEHYFLIRPSADGTLGGQGVDPARGHTISDQDVIVPFEDLAIVYYLEQPKTKRASVTGYAEHRSIPKKISRFLAVAAA